MKNIVLVIGSHIENDKKLYKDVLLHNLVHEIIQMKPIKTTDIDKLQGSGKRKVELKVTILLD